MQSDTQYCWIQGHEGQKLGLICTYLGCQSMTRWLCKKCTKEKIHNHNDGIYGFSFLRTDIEFQNHFQKGIMPQIRQLLNSEFGIKIKSQYIQTIFQSLEISIQKDNYIFSKDKNNQNLLLSAIDKLFKHYGQEINRIERIKSIYQAYNDVGLGQLNKEQIDYLLSLDNTTFTKDERNLFINIVCETQFILHQLAQQFELIKVISDRLKLLKDFISYQQYHFIADKSVSLDQVTLSQNENYMSVLNKEDQTSIQIHDLNSKKIKTKYYFKDETYVISLNPLWKYMVTYNNQHQLSYYYINSDKSIKLIKKYQLGYKIIDSDNQFIQGNNCQL